MSARREVRVGDRVTLGKSRRRFTVVAIYRPVSWWLSDREAAVAAEPGTRATIVERGGRHAYASPKSKRRGQGRRVDLARLVRA